MSCAYINDIAYFLDNKLHQKNPNPHYKNTRKSEMSNKVGVKKRWRSWKEVRVGVVTEYSPSCCL